MAAEPEYVHRTWETLRDIVTYVIRLLKQAGEMVSLAESLMGGGVMAAMTSVEGMSAGFRSGVVSCATSLEEQLLNVKAGLLSQYGVINANIVKHKAVGARIITLIGSTSTSWGIGTIGVDSPDSQDGKPIGMFFVGITSPDWSKAWGPFHLISNRDRIWETTIMESIARLHEALRGREIIGKILNGADDRESAQ